MTACFCTGNCRITGMCGGQRIWQLQPVQPVHHSSNAAWYAYWVSKCECQKHSIMDSGSTTALPQYGTFTSEMS